jgi:hypothetical protein
VSIFKPSQKGREHFDSDVDYELYLMFQKIQQQLNFDAGVEVQPSAGAVPQDESLMYHLWLRNANPIGYTSFIRTLPKSKWTDDDYKIIDGVKYDAPRRFARQAIQSVDGKKVYIDYRDTARSVDTRITREFALARDGKITTVETSWMTRDHVGLSPLGRPYLVSYVPLDFSSPRAFEQSKRKYLRRREYSQDLRKQHNKGPDPVSRVLVRRPPDVLWFCRNPDGKGQIYQDVWPTGIVDQGAAAINAEMNAKAAEFVNNQLHTEKFGVVPATPEPEAVRPEPVIEPTRPTVGKTQEKLSRKKMRRMERLARREGTKIEKGKSMLPMKAALNDYAQYLKESRSGYRPEDIHETADVIGYFVGPMPKAITVGHAHDSDIIEGEFTVVEETGKGNQSESETSATLQMAREQNRYPPMPRAQREKRNLQRLLDKVMEDQWDQATQPQSVQDEGSAHGYEDLLIPGGYVRIRYDDPDRYMPYLESLIKANQKTAQSLAYAYMKMRALHGIKWTEEFSLSDFFALDDESVGPRRMKLADLMPRKKGYNSNYSTFMRKCEEVDRRVARQSLWRTKGRVSMAKQKAIQDLMIPRLKAQRHRNRVRQEAAALRTLGLKARAYRHQMKSRKGDRRDARLMIELTRHNPRVKRVRRKIEAMMHRIASRFRGESDPTLVAVMPELHASHSQGESPQNNTASSRKAPTVRTVVKRPAEHGELIVPVPHEPIDIVAGRYIRIRKSLRLKGFSASDLEDTDEVIYKYYPRMWDKIAAHQEQRRASN